MRAAIRNTVLGVSLLVATPASAAQIINNYTVTASGLGGPVSNVSLSFTLSYDPALNTSSGTVTNFISSSPSLSFNPVGGVGFNFFSGPKQFQIGGFLNDPGGTVIGTNDFFLGFTDNGTTIANAIVGYTAVGQSTNFFTFNTQVTRNVAAAVPEPSTWAMMLLGFALIGGAIRSAKCRRKVTVAFA